jgi:hypothetical protein
VLEWKDDNKMAVAPCCFGEVAGTSETSVCIHRHTWRYNSEDNHLHSRRREELKSPWRHQGAQDCPADIWIKVTAPSAKYPAFYCFFVMVLHYVIAFIYLRVKDVFRTKLLCLHSVDWDAFSLLSFCTAFRKALCSHTTHRFCLSAINITSRAVYFCCGYYCFLIITYFFWDLFL